MALFRSKAALVIAVLPLCSASAFAEEEALSFETHIRPMVEFFCVNCHNEDEAKGDLNLERFATEDDAMNGLAVWQRIAKRIEAGEMPPEKRMQPNDEEKAQLLTWIAGLKFDKEDCDGIVSEESMAWYPGYVMSRRLNRAEYENTVSDLLGVDVEVAAMFPADGAGGEGFDNNGNALFLSAIHVEKYLDAAETAVAALPELRPWSHATPPNKFEGGTHQPTPPNKFEGGTHQPTPPNKFEGGTHQPTPPNKFEGGTHQPTPPNKYEGGTLAGKKVAAAAYFDIERFDLPGVADALHCDLPLPERDPERASAKALLEEYLPRAWRRPITASDVGGLMALYDNAREHGDNYDAAVKTAITAALVSPNFLFLAEPEPGVVGNYPLGDFPLASRLSYFLWGTMPDAELFAVARAGGLNDDAELQRQVARMLRDPKSAAMGELFAAQWLGITQLGETTRPDENRFPQFDDALAQAMQAEASAFFHHVLREDRSLLELIDADYTYANEELATLYNIEGVLGDDVQRVELHDPNRGGVLGMAAVLTATSHPLRTSPVLRGKWVLEQLLGDHVPPPPPDAGTLPEDDQDAEGLTLREQMEVHRANPDCASCHSRMDPIGFGLENFDPIGRWRVEQAGQPVDAQGTLPSGESFTGPNELKAILLARKDEFARNLARKMFGYAMGRSLTPFDECVIDDAMEAMQANDYRASALITEIVLGYPFRHRYSGGETE